MAKLSHFIILCILQLYSLCLNTPSMLYAYHFCPYDQTLSLLNFKSSLQIDTYSEYCRNEVGFFSFRNISSYCNRNGNPIIESKITFWNNNTDCCSWEGVTCDKFTGKVVELDLSDSRLIGVIHSNSTIFRLSHLKRLNLSYNSFYGSEISSEFHRFTHLSHLDLSNSEFQGQIPHEISQLNQLVSLDLSPNLIGLTLQPHIFKSILQNMTSLKELYLQNVKINSTFPKNLSSPLTIINLMSTELRGTFPYHIFNLPKLQQLNLGLNSFDHFGNSMSVKWNTSSPLQKLELSQVFLLEKQLESIGNLKSLLYLDISLCDLMGTLPQSFGNLTQLSYLDLSDNNFNGQLPEGILALGTNSLDAPIPHSASNNLKRLKVLFLKENQLTSGCVSSFLSNLTQLETIDLSRNPLYEIPPELFELSLLQSINLEETQLQGHIPNSFSNLINLQHLNLGSNNVSSHIGTIELSKLVSLVSLNLASNKFIGPIESKTFSNLINLKYLNLGSNNFNGPIEIDALVNLVYLDLSSNNFGTTLDVKFLSKLKWMDLLDLSFSNVSLINEDTVGNSLEFQMELNIKFDYNFMVYRLSSRILK